MVITPPSYFNGLDIVFCDTDLSDLGGVRCPSDLANCVPILWLCDGVRDCLAWEDEDITFCQKVRNKVEKCFGQHAEAAKPSER